jgi:hypothetical protein
MCSLSRSAPQAGLSGASPGFSLLSLPAFGREEKERKDVFRGHPEPRQRARRPLQFRLLSGSKQVEHLFRKCALCHALPLPQREDKLTGRTGFGSSRQAMIIKRMNQQMKANVSTEKSITGPPPMFTLQRGNLFAKDCVSKKRGHPTARSTQRDHTALRVCRN